MPLHLSGSWIFVQDSILGKPHKNEISISMTHEQCFSDNVYN